MIALIARDMETRAMTEAVDEHAYHDASDDSVSATLLVVPLSRTLFVGLYFIRLTF